MTGLATLVECFECLDETDTFLRTPPNLRRLSAPALALEVDLPIVAFEPLGTVVVGVVAWGVGAPL